MKLTPALATPFLLGYWLVLLTHILTIVQAPSEANRLFIAAVFLAGLPVTLMVARALAEERAKAVQEAAMRDDLTGLPGRRLFIERLNSALMSLRPSRASMAVMLLDLDRFKLVNDTMGHHMGDLLLKEVPHRLLSALRRGDTLARFGGDEFTVLLESVGSESEVADVAQRIVSALSKPFTLNGREVSVGASVGVSVCHDASLGAQELVRRADIALYQAKARGSGRVVLYEPMLSAPVGRLSLESDLRGAAGRGELCLLFQPEIDIAGERIAGFEALVRWNHPYFGLLPPEQFIRIAEEIGAIESIGQWVLREACRQARIWQELYGTGNNITVSINLSPLEFQQVNLLEQIVSALQQNNLDGSCLRIEITESVLMEDARRVAATLQTLRDKGVQIALDDFGTGYSSLTYLKHFSVDSIKIDQSFLRDIRDERSVAIVDSLIRLAHSLSMDVTAEGVETHQQLGLLRQLDCDKAQGYLFSRPLDASAVGELLARGSLSRLQVRGAA